MLAFVTAVILAATGVSARTTGATAVSEVGAVLHASIRCHQGSVCAWYWEVWPDSARGGSHRTAVRGPVRGPTGALAVSTRLIDLDPSTTYHWVVCVSGEASGTYRCAGPRGLLSSPTADPPPDEATFATAAPKTLALRFDGRRWTAQSPPNPPGAQQSSLHAVSCPARELCVAAGQSMGRTTGALIERWNGRKWVIEQPPGLGGNRAVLSVSCPSAHRCTAVGSGSGAPAGALAERWNGAMWKPQSLPPVAAGSTLRGVACPSAATCFGVGNTDGEARPFNYPSALVERWNAGRWTIRTAPAPASAVSSVLSAVACPMATACTAVGHYSDGNGRQLAYAERWRAGTWSVHAVAPGTGTGASFAAVACPLPDLCEAVGQRRGTGGYVTLAERWDGTKWTIQTTPNLPGSHGDALSAVSCSSATACSAVGYTSSRSGYRPLAERWNGRRWTVGRTPILRGAQFPRLDGISCSSNDTCTAVGTA